MCLSVCVFTESLLYIFLCFFLFSSLVQWHKLRTTFTWDRVFIAGLEKVEDRHHFFLHACFFCGVHSCLGHVVIHTITQVDVWHSGTEIKANPSYQQSELKPLTVPFRENKDTLMYLHILPGLGSCLFLRTEMFPSPWLKWMSQNVLLVSFKSMPWGLGKSLIRLKCYVLHVWTGGSEHAQ